MDHKTKKYKIDLSAPIIPGRSAGGFELGINIKDLDEGILNQFQRIETINPLFPDSPSVSYQTTNLILYLDNEIISQIGLFENYQGKLDSGLGLGDFVYDFEKVYGPTAEGDEDELIFKDLKGLCYEVDYSSNTVNSDNWQEIIPTLRVAELYIHNYPPYVKE